MTKVIFYYQPNGTMLTQLKAGGHS
uniref:(California timema) hypothetical protein n=1 Tax=Timema californicum TaxID=61474 RepID=A0A7R9JKD1_TIMCA|nr:unnamed protein product [Timema californicum]